MNFILKASKIKCYPIKKQKTTLKFEASQKIIRVSRTKPNMQAITAIFSSNHNKTDNLATYTHTVRNLIVYVKK